MQREEGHSSKRDNAHMYLSLLNFPAAPQDAGRVPASAAGGGRDGLGCSRVGNSGVHNCRHVNARCETSNRGALGRRLGSPVRSWFSVTHLHSSGRNHGQVGYQGRPHWTSGPQRQQQPRQGAATTGSNATGSRRHEAWPAVSCSRGCIS